MLNLVNKNWIPLPMPLTFNIVYYMFQIVCTRWLYNFNDYIVDLNK